MAEEILDKIANCIFKGDNKTVASLVPQALSEGLDPETILTGGLIHGMEKVSNKFKAEEFYIPQVLLSERALNTAMGFISEKLEKKGFKARGTVVIGTIKEDLHDIGKNLVAAMLRGQGFKIIDLKVNVTPEQFLEASKTHDADIVGMSALLTTTMDNMQATIKMLNAEGFKGKTIIGGAPVTQDFANKIGADLYAEDASTAVDKIKDALNIA